MCTVQPSTIGKINKSIKGPDMLNEYHLNRNEIKIVYDKTKITDCNQQ